MKRIILMMIIFFTVSSNLLYAKENILEIYDVKASCYYQSNGGLYDFRGTKIESYNVNALLKSDLSSSYIKDYFSKIELYNYKTSNHLFSTDFRIRNNEIMFYSSFGKINDLKMQNTYFGNNTLDKLKQLIESKKILIKFISKNKETETRIFTVNVSNTMQDLKNSCDFDSAYDDFIELTIQDNIPFTIFLLIFILSVFLIIKFVKKRK